MIILTPLHPIENDALSQHPDLLKHEYRFLKPDLTIAVHIAFQTQTTHRNAVCDFQGDNHISQINVPVAVQIA
jgi:hypothetical protein